MGNKNRRDNIHFGCAQIRALPPKQAIKPTTTKTVGAKSKPVTVCIALLLTDRDILKLGANRDALLQGTARRAGCSIDILPKKDGTTEVGMVFAGSPIAVTKGKTWIKERLIVSHSPLWMPMCSH
mgnify:CR=1 FL=1